MTQAETNAAKQSATKATPAPDINAPYVLTTGHRTCAADGTPALNQLGVDNPGVAEIPMVPGLTGLEGINSDAELLPIPPVVGPGQADSGAVVTETGFKPLTEPFAGGVDLAQLKAESTNDGVRDGYTALAANASNLLVPLDAWGDNPGVADALAWQFENGLEAEIEPKHASAAITDWLAQLPSKQRVELDDHDPATALYERQLIVGLSHGTCAEVHPERTTVYYPTVLKASYHLTDIKALTLAQKLNLSAPYLEFEKALFQNLATGSLSLPAAVLQAKIWVTRNLAFNRYEALREGKGQVAYEQSQRPEQIAAHQFWQGAIDAQALNLHRVGDYFIDHLIGAAVCATYDSPVENEKSRQHQRRALGTLNDQDFEVQLWFQKGHRKKIWGIPEDCFVEVRQGERLVQVKMNQHGYAMIAKSKGKDPAQLLDWLMAKDVHWQPGEDHSKEKEIDNKSKLKDEDEFRGEVAKLLGHGRTRAINLLHNAQQGDQLELPDDLSPHDMYCDAEQVEIGKGGKVSRSRPTRLTKPVKKADGKHPVGTESNLGDSKTTTAETPLPRSETPLFSPENVPQLQKAIATPLITELRKSFDLKENQTLPCTVEHLKQVQEFLFNRLDPTNPADQEQRFHAQETVTASVLSFWIFVREHFPTLLPEELHQLTAEEIQVFASAHDWGKAADKIIAAHQRMYVQESQDQKPSPDDIATARQHAAIGLAIFDGLFEKQSRLAQLVRAGMKYHHVLYREKTIAPSKRRSYTTSWRQLAALKRRDPALYAAVQMLIHGDQYMARVEGRTFNKGYVASVGGELGVIEQMLNCCYSKNDKGQIWLDPDFKEAFGYWAPEYIETFKQEVMPKKGALREQGLANSTTKSRESHLSSLAQLSLIVVDTTLQRLDGTLERFEHHVKSATKLAQERGISSKQVTAILNDEKALGKIFEACYTSRLVLEDRRLTKPILDDIVPLLTAVSVALERSEQKLNPQAAAEFPVDIDPTARQSQAQPFHTKTPVVETPQSEVTRDYQLEPITPQPLSVTEKKNSDEEPVPFLTLSHKTIVQTLARLNGPDQNYHTAVEILLPLLPNDIQGNPEGWTQDALNQACGTLIFMTSHAPELSHPQNIDEWKNALTQTNVWIALSRMDGLRRSFGREFLLKVVHEKLSLSHFLNWMAADPQGADYLTRAPRRFLAQDVFPQLAQTGFDPAFSQLVRSVVYAESCQIAETVKRVADTVAPILLEKIREKLNLSDLTEPELLARIQFISLERGGRLLASGLATSFSLSDAPLSLKINSELITDARFPEVGYDPKQYSEIQTYLNHHPEKDIILLVDLNGGLVGPQKQQNLHALFQAPVDQGRQVLTVGLSEYNDLALPIQELVAFEMIEEWVLGQGLQRGDTFYSIAPPFPWQEALTPEGAANLRVWLGLEPEQLEAFYAQPQAEINLKSEMAVEEQLHHLGVDLVQALNTGEQERTISIVARIFAKFGYEEWVTDEVKTKWRQQLSSKSDDLETGQKPVLDFEVGCLKNGKFLPEPYANFYLIPFHVGSFTWYELCPGLCSVKNKGFYQAFERIYGYDRLNHGFESHKPAFVITAEGVWFKKKYVPTHDPIWWQDEFDSTTPTDTISELYDADLANAIGEKSPLFHPDRLPADLVFAGDLTKHGLSEAVALAIAQELNAQPVQPWEQDALHFLEIGAYTTWDEAKKIAQTWHTIPQKEPYPKELMGILDEAKAWSWIRPEEVAWLYHNRPGDLQRYRDDMTNGNRAILLADLEQDKTGRHFTNEGQPVAGLHGKYYDESIIYSQDSDEVALTIEQQLKARGVHGLAVSDRSANEIRKTFKLSFKALPKNAQIAVIGGGTTQRFERALKKARPDVTVWTIDPSLGLQEDQLNIFIAKEKSYYYQLSRGEPLFYGADEYSGDKAKLMHRKRIQAIGDLQFTKTALAPPLDFESEALDVLVDSHGPIQHVSKNPRLLEEYCEEVIRVLKPGGVAYLNPVRPETYHFLKASTAVQVEVIAEKNGVKVIKLTKEMDGTVEACTQSKDIGDTTGRITKTTASVADANDKPTGESAADHPTDVVESTIFETDGRGSGGGNKMPPIAEAFENDDPGWQALRHRVEALGQTVTSLTYPPIEPLIKMIENQPTNRHKPLKESGLPYEAWLTYAAETADPSITDLQIAHFAVHLLERQGVSDEATLSLVKNQVLPLLFALYPHHGSHTREPVIDKAFGRALELFRENQDIDQLRDYLKQRVESEISFVEERPRRRQQLYKSLTGLVVDYHNQGLDISLAITGSWGRGDAQYVSDGDIHILSRTPLNPHQERALIQAVITIFKAETGVWDVEIMTTQEEFIAYHGTPSEQRLREEMAKVRSWKDEQFRYIPAIATPKDRIWLQEIHGLENEIWLGPEGSYSGFTPHDPGTPPGGTQSNLPSSPYPTATESPHPTLDEVASIIDSINNGSMGLGEPEKPVEEGYEIEPIPVRLIMIDSTHLDLYKQFVKESTTFKSLWSNNFTLLQEGSQPTLIGILANEKLVGVSAVDLRSEYIEVFQSEVLNEFQNKGYDQQLFIQQLLLAQKQHLGLKTRTKNNKVIKGYERLGALVVRGKGPDEGKFTIEAQNIPFVLDQLQPSLSALPQPAPAVETSATVDPMGQTITAESTASQPEILGQETDSDVSHTETSAETRTRGGAEIILPSESQTEVAENRRKSTERSFVDLSDSEIEALFIGEELKVITNPEHLRLIVDTKEKNQLIAFIVEDERSLPQRDREAFEPYLTDTFRDQFNFDRSSIHAYISLFRDKDQLYVADYQDSESIRGHQVTSAFYNQLDTLARAMGLRYVTGINDTSVVDYFIAKLGRYRLAQIKPELRSHFSRNPAVLEGCTIKFLYPEDEAQFVIPSELHHSGNQASLTHSELTGMGAEPVTDTNALESPAPLPPGAEQAELSQTISHSEVTHPIKTIHMVWPEDRPTQQNLAEKVIPALQKAFGSKLTINLFTKDDVDTTLLQGLSGQVTVVRFDPTTPYTDWIRDPVVLLNDKGTTKALLPVRKTTRTESPLNSYLLAHFQEYHPTESDTLMFEGGNMRFYRGTTLIGQDLMKDNQFIPGTREKRTIAEVETRFTKVLRMPTLTLPLPEAQEEQLIYHLDLALLPTAEGVAIASQRKAIEWIRQVPLAVWQNWLQSQYQQYHRLSINHPENPRYAQALESLSYFNAYILAAHWDNPEITGDMIRLENCIKEEKKVTTNLSDYLQKIHNFLEEYTDKVEVELQCYRDFLTSRGIPLNTNLELPLLCFPHKGNYALIAGANVLLEDTPTSKRVAVGVLGCPEYDAIALNAFNQAGYEASAVPLPFSNICFEGGLHCMTLEERELMNAVSPTPSAFITQTLPSELRNIFRDEQAMAAFRNKQVKLFEQVHWRKPTSTPTLPAWQRQAELYTAQPIDSETRASLQEKLNLIDNPNNVILRLLENTPEYLQTAPLAGYGEQVIEIANAQGELYGIVSFTVLDGALYITDVQGMNGKPFGKDSPYKKMGMEAALFVAQQLNAKTVYMVSGETLANIALAMEETVDPTVRDHLTQVYQDLADRYGFEREIGGMFRRDVTTIVPPTGHETVPSTRVFDIDYSQYYPEARLKTIEESSAEKSDLAHLYRQIYGDWQHFKGAIDRSFTPQELGKDFALVTWRTDTRITPAFFSYLNEYGCSRINVWVRNKQAKVLIVNCDLYTQGKDGSTRGKGAEGAQSQRDLLQRIADQTGYTVWEIATANAFSWKYLADRGDYQPFNEAMEQNLLTVTNDLDQDRWSIFMSRVKPFITKVKKYDPEPITEPLDQQRQGELEVIKDVLMMNF